MARQSTTIGFFKIANDGFGLGAQRRFSEKNDLPQARAEIAEYLRRLRVQESLEDYSPTLGQVVPKERIAANDDYNLRGERYRVGVAGNHSFPLVSLGDGTLFRVESGGTPKSDVKEYWGGEITWATLVDLPASNFITQITATQRAVPENVALAVSKVVPTMKAWATGGTFAEISKTKFCELQIPLPPLEVQKLLVAEIEGYEAEIAGLRDAIADGETKIQAALARVWSEDEPGPTEA